MAYGSTKIRAADDYCPRAIDHIDAGTPTHREHFAVGTACHVALEHLQDARNEHGREVTPDEAADVLDRVRAGLIAGGRQWRGLSDPPLRPQQVQEGLELAMAWHAKHGTIEAAIPELGIGVVVEGKALRAVPYRDTPHDGYRTSLDLHYYDHVGGDEDGDEGHILVVARDYKTGWNAGDDMLDGSQMRAQAVLALMRADADGVAVAGVRIEIGAIRTGRVHSRTLYLVDDAQTLDAWVADLVAVVRGLEGQRPGETRQRPAVPSVRCGGCPYLHACDEGRAWVTATRTEPAEMAAQLVAVEALRTHLTARLKDVLTDGDTITVEGYAVGHVGRTSRVVRDTAPAHMTELWGAGQDWTHDLAAGMVLAMRPGATQAESLAKALHPGRGDKAKREALVAEWTETKHSGAFGVRRVNGEESET
jgi:hypothetical protein